MHHIFDNKFDKSIRSCFQVKKIHYETSRHKHQFKTSPVKTVLDRRKFSFRGQKIWNAIPNKLKEIEMYPDFKSSHALHSNKINTFSLFLMCQHCILNL